MWEVGKIKAEAQNLARRLTDTPSNLMTPTIFSKNATELFKDSNSVKVCARDKKWIQSQKMNTFLSVTRGSEEPPIFLEINYRGVDSSTSKPVILVGTESFSIFLKYKTNFFL